METITDLEKDIAKAEESLRRNLKKKATKTDQKEEAEEAK